MEEKFNSLEEACKYYKLTEEELFDYIKSKI